MSLVYITYHNENIFDVEKDPIAVHRQRGHYVSKFKKVVREEKNKCDVVELEDGRKLLTDAKKSRHKTMGIADVDIDAPCNFLRKNQGIKWRRLNEHVCPPRREIPPVPHYVPPKHERSQHPPESEEVINIHCPLKRYFRNHKHRANFIAVNIDRVKSSQTKRPPPRYVDTPKGDRHDLLNTGLLPQYMCAKKYGHVPRYLEVHKNMLKEIRESCQRDREEEEQRCVDMMTHPGVRKLKPEEREQILTGLKSNYTTVSKTYQGLSLYTDTVAKKLRKNRLEKELRQLEQDIFLIEANPVILVSKY